ncbi:hypothetical protein OCF65_21410 [Bacillus toyonensis]|uniref:hypothetical protein n=1 Tax=Bacillus toyonensis TaxID=155322 RepID=UPI0021D0ADA9|nr:hypothetical protein [Bacillus toyonensis]MCU5582989.1 hypothetical protein [Bacillus toyonensis]
MEHLFYLFENFCDKHPKAALFLIRLVFIITGMIILPIVAVLTVSMFVYAAVSPEFYISAIFIFISLVVIPFLLKKYFQKLKRDAREEGLSYRLDCPCF